MQQSPSSLLLHDNSDDESAVDSWGYAQDLKTPNPQLKSGGQLQVVYLSSDILSGWGLMPPAVSTIHLTDSEDAVDI